MSSLTSRITLGWAFVAILFLILVSASVVHHMRTTCYGQCSHDYACFKRCDQRNFCPHSNDLRGD